ncbi:MAG: acyl-ACP--UDP-N-acetylglucosamine O-acyltransferase [Planctomycetia bacterium]|nr:MAG: acyl-ACP--UDP-N-acetylglucosamine O-acyltransferase [Planctomycetia bacterium]
MPIHSTAVVDASAEISRDAEIGPYCIVEKGVRISDGVRLIAHVYVGEGTTIEPRVVIHPFATIGQPPQDLAFTGEPTFTRIGEETIIREHVSIHRGTMPGSITTVGRRGFLMACSHVAHNCTVGDDVKMANGALLAGHVSVGDKAFIAGNTAIHQFVRVGELAMISGVRVTNDVVPFMILGPMGVVGPNVVGLRRAGMSPAERMEIREGYRTLFRSGISFRVAAEQVAGRVTTEPGRRLAAFVTAPSKRGYTPYRGRKHIATEDAEA